MARIPKLGGASLLPLFLALVVACTTDSQVRGSTRFSCESEGDLVVTFAPGRAIVRTSDGTVHTLPQAEAASGARYTNGTHEFWNKGRDATWTIGRMVPIQCRTR